MDRCLQRYEDASESACHHNKIKNVPTVRKVGFDAESNDFNKCLNNEDSSEYVVQILCSLVDFYWLLIPFESEDQCVEDDAYHDRVVKHLILMYVEEELSKLALRWL